MVSFRPVAVSFDFSVVAVVPEYLLAISAIAFALSPEMRTNFFWAFIKVMMSPVLPSMSVVIWAASMRALLVSTMFSNGR